MKSALSKCHRGVWNFILLMSAKWESLEIQNNEFFFSLFICFCLYDYIVSNLVLCNSPFMLWKCVVFWNNLIYHFNIQRPQNIFKSTWCFLFLFSLIVTLNDTCIKNNVYSSETHNTVIELKIKQGIQAFDTYAVFTWIIKKKLSLPANFTK